MTISPPPSTVEIVSSTSGWSKPSSRIVQPNAIRHQTTVKYSRLSVQRRLERA